MVISLLGLVVVVAALYPLRVPFVAARRTYLGQRLPAELPLMSGTTLAVPPTAESRMAPLVEQLERHGFERVTRVGPRGGSGGTYAHVLRHPEPGTLAWVIDMRSGSASTTYVELITEYEDGRAVMTLNHASPSIFKTPPHVHKTLVRSGSVDEIVPAHRSACASITEPPCDRAGVDPLDIAQRQNREVLDHQVTRGLLRHVDGAYGFTRRGAFKSALRLWVDGLRPTPDPRAATS